MKPASCLQVWLSLARQRALAILIIVLAPSPQALAARLGGAYYVDDAEIGKPGSCEIESWGSFALNRDHIAVFSPACVVNLGGPVELGTNLVNLRSQGEKDSLVSLTAKAVPITSASAWRSLAPWSTPRSTALAAASFSTSRSRTTSASGSGSMPISGAQFNNGDPRGSLPLGRRCLLEFRAALERHFRGLRPDWTWRVRTALSERNSLQPNATHRLGCDLRPQPRR
jgi:hypothetical protein